MLLNRQRLFLTFAIFLMALFGASCVDIPAEGITPPNYQSSVKFFNFGRGVDTISHITSSLSYTAKDSVTVLSITGTDTVRVKTKHIYTVLINRYNRYHVDFSKPLDLFVDGSQLATLTQGQTTNYTTIASGARLIALKGDGTFVDSIRYTKVDTATTVTYDTIRNAAVKGSKIVSLAGTSATVLIIPNFFGAVSKITVDSSLVSVETERQMCLHMIGDTLPNQTGLAGLLRFGRMRYLVTAERKTYEPLGKVDSALVIVNNNFPGPTLRLFKSALLKDSIAALAFKVTSGNIPYLAKTDSTYKFVFRNPANLAAVDSVSLTLSKGKQYSIAVYDSAGARKIRAYAH